MKQPLAESFVRECRRAWLKRTIRLAGASETEIELDAVQVGIGSERLVVVRVDGLVVGKWLLPVAGSRHHVDFHVRSLKVGGRMELSISGIGLLQLTYLQLTLGSRVYYEEEAGKVLQFRSPPPIPIPAEAPPADPRKLPIPTAAGERSG